MIVLDFKLFIENEKMENIPKGKLFGLDAKRVSTQELELVVQELRKLIGSNFSYFERVDSLKEKHDHGDIDILVIPPLNIKQLLNDSIPEKVLKFSKNDCVNSFLFQSEYVNKNVHVDLITCENKEKLQSKKYYYGLNDFSALVGVLSKKLNFKYGTEGFFKRFKDKKGNWHDVFITFNLLKGLEILGFDISLYNKIKNYNDIAEFVLTSPLFDYRFFTQDALLARDRVSLGRRPNLEQMINFVIKSNKTATITDEDHFFKKLMPEQYKKCQEEMKEINNKTYEIANKYNGSWLMLNFGLKPGPDVGKILKLMNDKFKENLPNADEQEVVNFVKLNLNK
jgi:hypothetical protein